MSHVPSATSGLTQLTAPAGHATPTHLQQLNKLQQLYPPPSFGHPALPIAGVTLMPQLCHPILHQNLGASLYPAPPNGIKQEYGCQDVSSLSAAAAAAAATSSASAVAAAQAAALASLRGGPQQPDDPDMALNLEPEIILQTPPDVNPAQQQQHHFNAHQQQQQQQHHLQQQQQQHCNMFQHMAPQAHMQHMRAAPLPPPPTVALPPPPPPSSSTTHQQQPQPPPPPPPQQQQQQQLQQHAQ
ncbi:homeobox protein B-H2-like [Drosophila hydei]|uniref:Homeobox protein B-H2-like n=1 Tax=Drosophila hydei TaxID=7224 RepID=A0A6J1LIL6_DROHY|nr:homeobox protein B-H2-like [Drosophila hydei]